MKKGSDEERNHISLCQGTSYSKDQTEISLNGIKEHFPKGKEVVSPSSGLLGMDEQVKFAKFLF